MSDRWQANLNEVYCVHNDFDQVDYECYHVKVLFLGLKKSSKYFAQM